MSEATFVTSRPPVESWQLSAMEAGHPLRFELERESFQYEDGFDKEGFAIFLELYGNDKGGSFLVVQANDVAFENDRFEPLFENVVRWVFSQHEHKEAVRFFRVVAKVIGETVPKEVKI